MFLAEGMVICWDGRELGGLSWHLRAALLLTQAAMRSQPLTCNPPGAGVWEGQFALPGAGAILLTADALAGSGDVAGLLGNQEVSGAVGRADCFKRPLLMLQRPLLRYAVHRTQRCSVGKAPLSCLAV